MRQLVSCACESAHRRFLRLCAQESLETDTLSSLLLEATGDEADCTRLALYATETVQPEELRRLLELHCKEWIVFLSPAGVSAVGEQLGLEAAQAAFEHSNARIAAFGPTTAAACERLLGVVPVAVSEKPTPASMMQAIVVACCETW